MSKRKEKTNPLELYALFNEIMYPDNRFSVDIEGNLSVDGSQVGSIDEEKITIEYRINKFSHFNRALELTDFLRSKGYVVGEKITTRYGDYDFKRLYAFVRRTQDLIDRYPAEFDKARNFYAEAHGGSENETQ